MTSHSRAYTFMMVALVNIIAAAIAATLFMSALVLLFCLVGYFEGTKLIW